MSKENMIEQEAKIALRHILDYLPGDLTEYREQATLLTYIEWAIKHYCE